ncbi:conserved protein of unknown function [Thauera humireducens]|uniref:hypothetical protein n=1 Tax=Thauera humireducens TaxID=1134435 RepID=UPI002467A5AD|nr:hypothetical protein [Thauera humireducens]CAH1748282.1 conserved protein of unknown function [Thauera humireducens]
MMLDVESTIWVGGLLSLGLVVLMHLSRQRKRRRDAHLYEIPPFLRGTADAGDDTPGNAETDWLEIHPAPGRHRKKD